MNGVERSPKGRYAPPPDAPSADEHPQAGPGTERAARVDAQEPATGHEAGQATVGRAHLRREAGVVIDGASTSSATGAYRELGGRRMGTGGARAGLGAGTASGSLR